MDDPRLENLPKHLTVEAHGELPRLLRDWVLIGVLEHEAYSLFPELGGYRLPTIVDLINILQILVVQQFNQW